VGLKLNLRDFSLDEVNRLKEMYRCPLNRAQVQSLYDLLGGQPYLTVRGLSDIARGLEITELIAKAGP
jgi:hypothetical protein